MTTSKDIYQRKRGATLAKKEGGRGERYANLECQFYEVLPLECCVGAGHGNDLGLLDQQVVDPVSARPQQLKGTELLPAMEGEQNNR